MLIEEEPWEITSTFRGPDGVEDSSSEARCGAEPDANDCDDGPSLLDPRFSQLGQIPHDGVKARAILDSERDTDFPAGEHVYGGLVPLEDLEERPEEAVGAAHAGGPDVHDGDSLLPGNGAYGRVAHRLDHGCRSNRGTAAFGTSGVQNHDGYPCADEGKRRGWMENLGAEGGELRRLVIARRLQGAGARDDP